MRFWQIIVASSLLSIVTTACQQHQQQGAENTSAPEVEAIVLPKPAEEKPRCTVTETPKPTPAQEKKEEADLVPGIFEPVKIEPVTPRVPGKRIARVDVPGPYVALTFDDGPSAANTPRILNILRNHGAHATFFVAGEQAVHNKSILARAAAEGHEIGTHTYSHIKMTGSSDAKIDSEMSRTNAIIREATGKSPVIMRPPYGATNPRLVNKMYQDYGMYSILWDVDTQDWKHPGVGTVIKRAVGNARPGSIILVHDIHESTANAVEGIVSGLQKRGFKLVTVSELIALADGHAPEPAAPAPAEGDEEAPVAPVEESPAVEAAPPAEDLPTGAAELGQETSQETTHE